MGEDSVKEMMAAGAGLASLSGFAASGTCNIAVLPDGYRVANLEEFQEAPNRIRANHTFTSIVSLATYLKRFATDATMVTVNYQALSVDCVIDGDVAMAVDDDSEDDVSGFTEHFVFPSHKTHFARFRARISQELQPWLDLEKKGFVSQRALSEFLEERAVDVYEPSPADIMEIVMNFDAARKVKYRSSLRLSDGRRQYEYVEENDTGRGSLVMPEQLHLHVPLFAAEPAAHVKVMLRYRIDDGSLQFKVVIHDAAALFRRAFDDVLSRLRIELGCGVSAERAETLTNLPLYIVG